MTNTTAKYPRLLAIDPTSRGFAYAIFEGPSSLIDWGLTRARNGCHSQRIKRLQRLIEYSSPDVLVLEDCNRIGSPRRSSARRLIGHAALASHRNGIRTARFTRDAIRRFFAVAGGVRKHEIAITIARAFPELAPRLPRVRKIWMSEDERMSIFDAASLALVYYGARPAQSNQVQEAA